jgi:hypothetical protein
LVEGFVKMNIIYNLMGGAVFFGLAFLFILYFIGSDNDRR